MKRSEAMAIAGMLAAYYDTPAWTEERIRLFAELIVDLDADMARAAAIDWMRKSHAAQRPHAADIRRLIAKAQAGSALEPEDAWSYVVDCFRTVGGYRKFPDTHPLVARAVAAMGWNTLCESCDQMADRAHFLRIYGAMLEREVQAAQASAGATLPATRPPALAAQQQAVERRGALLELVGGVGRKV